MSELEHRLALAVRADSVQELQGILADLPAESESRLRVTHEKQVVPPRSVLAAVMGGHVRKGSWVVPRHLKVVAIMGGAELDLRSAVLSSGVTEIEVFVLMGGVEIYVPPGVRVESMGIAVMGGFESSAGDASATDPDQPVLRISGFAVMGGVDARMKQASAKTMKQFRRALLRARSGTHALRGRTSDR